MFKFPDRVPIVLELLARLNAHRALTRVQQGFLPICNRIDPRQLGTDLWPHTFPFPLSFPHQSSLNPSVPSSPPHEGTEGELTSGHLGAGRLVSYLLCTAPSADLKEITFGEWLEWREREENATEREEKSHSPKSALRSSERKGRFVRNPSNWVSATLNLKSS